MADHPKIELQSGDNAQERNGTRQRARARGRPARPLRSPVCSLCLSALRRRAALLVLLCFHRDALNVSEGRFEYLGEETLVSRVGSALLFLSIASHKQSVLQFPAGYSLDAWTVSNPTPAPSNHGAAQVVVALSGVDTRIHVYSWPRLHLEQSMVADAEVVCYTRLALSRDGRHLAAVTGEAQVALRYWDLQAPATSMQIFEGSEPDHPTNRMLRDRDVRLLLSEPAAFLAFNPFNHTQVVVGSERSVQVVTITAATSFQIATLTPQPVNIDHNNLNQRKVQGVLWVSDRQLLMHTQTGEILSAVMQTPAVILAMRERELAAQQAAAQAAGGADTPALDRSVSNATPGNNAASGSNQPPAEIELGLTHLPAADLALLGLVDPRAPAQARIDWKNEEAKGWAAASALHVTTWASHLPLAPASGSGEDGDEDEPSGAVAKGRGAGASSLSASSSGGAVASCMALTRHEVVIGTNDGCLLWLNKHTQTVSLQQHIDVSGGSGSDTGVLALSFSPTFSTFVALTRRGHLRLFKPTSDRAAPPAAAQQDGSAPQAAFQTSSLGHFPLASALALSNSSSGVVAPAAPLPHTLLTCRTPVRVGHVLLPAHPGDLQPRNFKLLSYSSQGVLQLWCYGTRQLLGTYQFRAPVTACAVSLDGNLAVVGLSSGVLNILDLTQSSYMRLVFSHRFHAGPVLAVEFNKEGDMFASMGPRKIFFVRTGDFRVVGYSKLSEWEGSRSSAGGAAKTEEKDGMMPLLTRQGSAEVEAQKAAQAVLLAEKEKHDDEDETGGDVDPSVVATEGNPAAVPSQADSLLAMCWSSPADGEKQANERVVLSTRSGRLIVLTAPNIYHDGAELKLDPAFLAPVITPVGSGIITSLSCNLSDRTQLFATTTNKLVEIWALLADNRMEQAREPLNADIPLDAEGQPALESDVEEIGPDQLLHQQAPTVVAQALTGNLFASSGADGMIVLRDGESLGYMTRFPIHDFLLGGTCSLSIAPDSSLLISSGFDGSLLVFDLSPLAPTIGSRRTRKLKNLPQAIHLKVLEQLPEVDESAGASDASYLAAHSRLGSLGGQAKEKDLQSRILKDELIKSLAAFKMQFQEILLRNSRLPDFEQLTYTDFAIDLELKAFLKAEGDKRVALIREQIHAECLGKEYIIARIKNQVWEKMETKGQMIASFRGNSAQQSQGSSSSSGTGANEQTEVHNWPLRVQPPSHLKRLKQLQFLRRMEITEKRWRFNQSLKSDENDVVDKTFNPQKFTEDASSYLVNYEGERDAESPLLQGAQGRGEDKKEKEGGAGDKKGGGAGSKDAPSVAKRTASTLGGVGSGASSSSSGHGKNQSVGASLHGGDLPIEHMPRFLLYHPLDIVTPLRKRAQTLLLGVKIEALKRAFNEIFDDFYALKQREIEHIHEKAKRIQEIQNELQMDLPVYKPILAPEEIAASVLTVEDAEIKAPKVLSKAERLIADAKAERERANNENADDGPERGLEVMMGGTLETKRDLSLLEQELIPEEWMKTTPVESMTEDQKAELAKFEKKVKLIQLEQETRRKLLGTELSKLKNDVADIAKTFDSKLKSQLIEHRITVSREIYQHELQIIKLLNDLLVEEEKAAEEAAVANKIRQLRQAQSVAEALLAEVEREYRSSQAQYQAMQDEYKNADKLFLRDMRNGGISPEQQQAAQAKAAEAAAEYAALVAEQQAQVAVGSGELLDEHGAPLELPPQPPAPFMGAGISLEPLYKLLKKPAQKSMHARKKTLTGKMGDPITGRPRGSSGLVGGRHGLLGSFTSTMGAAASAGGPEGSLTPSGDRRSSSREGHLSATAAAGAPRAGGKRRKGDGDDDGGDGTMNPYPTDLLSHLSWLYAHHPHSIAAGPNPSLLEEVKYMDVPKPDNLDDEFWYSLLERRQEIVEREREVKRFNYRLQELSAHLKHTHDLSTAIANEIRSLSIYHGNLVEARSLFALNAQILLRIQQGQVEIDESPVVSDLREVEMMDRTSVEELNAVIKKSGQEKVEILRDTTVSRTAINILEWTRKKLQLEHEDSIDLTTELQNLRVTKELQKLIAMGGMDNMRAAEAKAAERKMEFLAAANRDTLLGKKLQLLKVKRKIKQQNRENERLYETVQELEAAVKERMQISSIRGQTQANHRTHSTLARGLTQHSAQRLVCSFVCLRFSCLRVCSRRRSPGGESRRQGAHEIPGDSSQARRSREAAI